MELNNRHFIDGMDLWNVFSIFVESGSDGFLQYAARKESISHDWLDRNGVDVDLSRYFFDSRNITLRCAMMANSEADFWLKHQGFIAMLTQPGPRRITVVEFGERSFMVYYKECNDFDRFTRIKDTNQVATKFTLVLVESEPSVDSSHEFIVDEEGRFLIT